MSLSKQMCAKPVSREVWRLDDVAAQWDKLVLRSYAIGSERRLYQGERRLYQEGSVKAIRPLTELFRLYGGAALPPELRCFAARSPFMARSHPRTSSRWNW